MIFNQKINKEIEYYYFFHQVIKYNYDVNSFGDSPISQNQNFYNLLVFKYLFILLLLLHRYDKLYNISKISLVRFDYSDFEFHCISNINLMTVRNNLSKVFYYQTKLRLFPNISYFQRIIRSTSFFIDNNKN